MGMGWEWKRKFHSHGNRAVHAPGRLVRIIVAFVRAHALVVNVGMFSRMALFL